MSMNNKNKRKRTPKSLITAMSRVSAIAIEKSLARQKTTQKRIFTVAGMKTKN